MTPFIKRAGARGFSIAELMVSIVIGMLALVFATRLLLSSEENKDVSLGGSDSMQNGVQAMLSIKNDMEQSGFGLNDPLINGCDAVFRDARGFELAEATRGTTIIHPLTAVIIKANGAAPDTISVYSGASEGGTGSIGMTTPSTASGIVTLERNPFGFRRDDVVVAVNQVAAQNVKCKVSQIGAEPNTAATPPTLDLGVSQARFNSNTVENPNYFANRSRLFNLGQANELSLHTWSVAGHFLSLRASEMAGATQTPESVMDNIVSIKAQYGFDTRSTAAFNDDAGVQRTGMQVDRWSATMFDADSDGTAGDRDDWARVAAVRLAVVARGRNVQKTKAGAACDATPSSFVPTVFASPEPNGVTAAPIVISLAVPGDPVDYKCYRYRFFETIVPLRNGGWRPTATRPTRP